MQEYKKYSTITRINPQKFVKFHVDNLLKFHEYLIKQWNKYDYINVYDSETHLFLKRFYSTNPPTSPQI
jgi:hypothetical protein